MYRNGGGGSSKSEIVGGTFDRKRINDALDKHLEKSNSRVLNISKESSRLSMPSSSTARIGKLQQLQKQKQVDYRDNRSSSTFTTKNKCSYEESERDNEESDVSGSDRDDDTSWISWFCNLRGNEFFCEVDDDYIQDDFNLCGLSSQVPYYDYALDLILDVESSHEDSFTEEQNELVESAAEMLYGLIHVRYILTTKGMATMIYQPDNHIRYTNELYIPRRKNIFLPDNHTECIHELYILRMYNPSMHPLEKYKNYDFGRCPRVYCCGQPCLPVGQSDIPRSSTVKIYCPRCEDICYPRSKYQGNIDGSYFGTTFPHLFLMTYGHLKPQKPTHSYVPRVFGFKLHK